LKKLKKYLSHKVKLPVLGHYRDRSFDDEDLWMEIVIQFCVMGGARMIERLIKDSLKYSEFQNEIGLSKLLSIKESERKGYIGNVFKTFKVTRFHSQQAKKITSLFSNSKVIRHRRIVLLDGLSYKQPFNKIRDELIRRNPYFKLKSASDFMIKVGLSHDVIALDTRILGILNDHFGQELKPNKVQGNKRVYELIEEALRKACKRIRIPLAHLDRIVFKFSGKSAIAFILEDWK
jgi:thermostable 8-oxoguanine DNA glycosylase